MTCKKYLSLQDRKKIEALYASGSKPNDIAAEIGVHLATIYRELARGYTGELDDNGRRGYNAVYAHEEFLDSMRRRGHNRAVNRKSPNRS